MNYLRQGRNKLDIFRGIIRERRVSGLPIPRKRVLEDGDEEDQIAKRVTQPGRSQSPLSVRFCESHGVHRVRSMPTEPSSPDSSNNDGPLLGGISLNCYLS
jgi:hypothetical protein